MDCRACNDEQAHIFLSTVADERSHEEPVLLCGPKCCCKARMNAGSRHHQHLEIKLLVRHEAPLTGRQASARSHAEPR